LRQAFDNAYAAIEDRVPTTFGTVTRDGAEVVVSAHGGNFGGLAGGVSETVTDLAARVSPSRPTMSTFVLYRPAGSGGATTFPLESTQFGDNDVGCDEPDGDGAVQTA
jgi:hypothetical protein